MSLISDLTAEEQEAIKELRCRFKNELTVPLIAKDKTVFYRFLKAQDFNVDSAEEMIRKSIAWRKAFQVDTILQDFTPKPFFVKYIKASHLGFDKNGYSVVYWTSGNTDFTDISKCVKMNDYIRHWIWYMEENLEFERHLEEKTGREPRVYTFIIDLTTATLADATNRILLDYSSRINCITKNNYPGYLKALYFINVPEFLAFGYSAIKAVISNTDLEKVHIFGCTGWKEKLLEVIDADVLPAFLGGKRTDPDGNPLCMTFVNHGDSIPETYYLTPEEREFKNKYQVKQIIILAGEKAEISVYITENASRIQWEFQLESMTIGFGLFYRVSQLELEEILPIQTFETVDGVEVGSYKTKSKGEYIIVFDNSYSWWNSKEVEYCITVLRPEI